MRAKEYLQQLERLDICINQKLEEIDELKKTATSISSVNATSEKVVGGPIKTDAEFVKYICKIDELKQEVEKEIDLFINEKHKIINQIQGLDKLCHIDILYKRYIDYNNYPNLETIAVVNNRSYRHITRLHGNALEEFRKKFL